MAAPPITPITIPQKILAPNMSAPGIPLDPWVVDLYTDNIIKQTIDRLLAYRRDKKYWDVLNLDELGRLFTTDYYSSLLISYDYATTLASLANPTLLSEPPGSIGIIETLDFSTDSAAVGLQLNIDGTDFQCIDTVYEAGITFTPARLFATGGECALFVLDNYDPHTPGYSFHLKRSLKFYDSFTIKALNEDTAEKALVLPYSYRVTTKPLA